MRLIKVKIKPSIPFWLMGPVKLTQDNKESPYLDVDKLTEEQVSIILKAKEYGEIRIFDINEKEIASFSGGELEHGFIVSADDEEEPFMPEIQSVTIPITHEEEEEEESYEDEAVLVLQKNGNTIKKMVQSMSSSSKENVKLLKAMLLMEKKDKKRNGIIEQIESVLRG